MMMVWLAAVNTISQRAKSVAAVRAEVVGSGSEWSMLQQGTANGCRVPRISRVPARRSRWGNGRATLR